MIENLERALGQAADGSVPYSSDAVRIMTHELEMRRRLVGD